MGSLLSVSCHRKRSSEAREANHHLVCGVVWYARVEKRIACACYLVFDLINNDNSFHFGDVLIPLRPRWDIRPALAVSTPDGPGRGVVLRPRRDLILTVPMWSFSSRWSLVSQVSAFQVGSISVQLLESAACPCGKRGLAISYGDICSLVPCSCYWYFYRVLDLRLL